MKKSLLLCFVAALALVWIFTSKKEMELTKRNYKLIPEKIVKQMASQKFDEKQYETNLEQASLSREEIQYIGERFYELAMSPELSGHEKLETLKLAKKHLLRAKARRH